MLVVDNMQGAAADHDAVPGPEALRDVGIQVKADLHRHVWGSRIGHYDARHIIQVVIRAGLHL